VCVKIVEVALFGGKVKALDTDGAVTFERDSFVKAIGKARAMRIYSAMNEAFDFIGPDGVDTLVTDGKEHLLCGLVLADKNANPELLEYAKAWVEAYELLRNA
jgi:hypothetical protein